MSTPAPKPQGVDEQKVVALVRAIDWLLGERREAEALGLLQQAEALAPEHPLVLHERARRHLATGDPHAARELLERAVAVAPRHLPLWLTLAAALRSLGRRPDELRALDRALTVDPTHLIALLQKAAVLDLMQQPRSAASVYANALQTLAPGTQLPPAVAAHVQHARRRVAENAEALAAAVEARIGPLRAGRSPGEWHRFERCMDRILGRRRIYTPEPTFMLFPYLNNVEFIAREQFPWLEAVEAATHAIREELLGVLSVDQAGIQPYIAYDENQPIAQWKELNHSRRWGAYFLHNEGRRVEEHMARCPRTVATLAELPQVNIPGHGPTAFFSILEAHTRIPPHTGVTNTRLTVHLPLIVPAGCGFRVGGETREWQVGTAWVFDDSIEHEAWNDSDVPRAILIFDIWNPALTPLERDLVREATTAIGDYYKPEVQPEVRP